MRVDLSRDGGATWTTIAASVANTTAMAGNHTWTGHGSGDERRPNSCCVDCSSRGFRYEQRVVYDHAVKLKLSIDRGFTYSVVLVGALTATAAVYARTAAQAPEIVAKQLSETFAIEYQPGSDLVLISGRAGLESIAHDGTRARFGRLSNLTPGAPVEVSKDEDGEFERDEIFTAGGVGQIVKLSTSGAVVGQPWASLPGELGVVTALHIDRTGVFDGAVLAGTAKGDIWRVDRSGKPAFLAATGLPITALITVPDVERYGEWAGVLIAATGPDVCRLVSVTPAGETTETDPGMCLADLDLVQPAADLYIGAVATKPASGDGFLLRTSADAMTSYACDIVGADRAGSLIFFASNTLTAAPRLSFPGLSPRALSFASDANACQHEICGDDIDNNGDGDVDEGCREVCGDGIDNDSNGEIDEDCREVCGDGEDNDDNGLVDDDCVEICGDKIDNDSDDLVDTPCSEICKDGIDNDQDGDVDEDCTSTLADAGCGPVRWLANPSAWVALEPDHLAGLTFSLNDALAPVGLRTLRATLQSPPTDAKIASAGRLVRAATSALLNAMSPRVGYPLTSGRILSQVDAALESGRPMQVEALASVLEVMNERSCPLPAQEARPKVPAAPFK